MSRAFAREDDALPEPDYRLPEPESEYYDEAAAWALIQGADAGDTKSAELATGYGWGEKRLIPQIEAILARAREEDQPRVAQLARRFLRAAGG